MIEKCTHSEHSPGICQPKEVANKKIPAFAGMTVVAKSRTAGTEI
jgi:hypothetical protein